MEFQIKLGANPCEETRNLISEFFKKDNLNSPEAFEIFTSFSEHALGKTNVVTGNSKRPTNYPCMFCYAFYLVELRKSLTCERIKQDYHFFQERFKKGASKEVAAQTANLRMELHSLDCENGDCVSKYPV